MFKMQVGDDSVQVNGAEKFFLEIFSSMKELRQQYELALSSYRNLAKALADKESELMASLNNGKDLENKLASSKYEYNILKSEYDELLKSYESTRLELDRSMEKSTELSENLTLSIQSYKLLEFEAEVDRHEAELQIKELNDGIEEISSSYDSLKQKMEGERCNFLVKIETLQDQFDELKKRMIEVDSRYSLVCSAISPNKIRSERYDRFNELVTQHLLPLINRVTVLPNEAEQVIKIRAVDDELRLAESLKAFSERTIIAVAGGFSSGKSSFITSLFANEELSLPIGIEPVTAIPTYVFHADKLNINGYPADGGCFEIPQEMYARLSHRFVEEFGFNLRDLLPFISLEVPMKSYKNLAFIDLPGYNPGDRDGSTSGDRSASEEYIDQAQALIWMIGLDANGTIPRDDLDHLWEFAASNISLYVVLNKADLRPLVSLDEVLDQVADELMMAGINYTGLCAYSSESGGELVYRECSLWHFLEEWDRPRHVISSIVMKIKEVLSVYKDALSRDIEERKMKSGIIKALELNLLELGAFDEREINRFDLGDYMDISSSDNHRKNNRRSSRSAFLRDIGRVEDGDAISFKINLVKDQIKSIRESFSTDESENFLNEFIKIEGDIESILYN